MMGCQWIVGGCRCWLTSWSGGAHTTNRSLCILFNICIQILTSILHIQSVLICRETNPERLHFRISQDRLQHWKFCFEWFLRLVWKMVEQTYVIYLLPESHDGFRPQPQLPPAWLCLRCCTPFRRGGVVPWSVSKIVWCFFSRRMEPWVDRIHVSSP